MAGENYRNYKYWPLASTSTQTIQTRVFLNCFWSGLQKKKFGFVTASAMLCFFPLLFVRLRPVPPFHFLRLFPHQKKKRKGKEKEKKKEKEEKNIYA